MSQRDDEAREPAIDSFVSGANRSLADWRDLWERDRIFPMRRRAGFVGRLSGFVKRLVRRVVRPAQFDLLERQRIYNLLVLEQLERLGEVWTRLAALGAVDSDQATALTELTAGFETLGKDLQKIQAEQQQDLRLVRENLEDLDRAHWEIFHSHHRRVKRIEDLHSEGWDEVMDQTEALFARLDQKLDRYRELSRERWGRLGGLLEIARSGGAPALARAVHEERYVEFEARFRGRETDIAARLEPYLTILDGRGEVLDLGCGRGEALEVFTGEGLECRGVDSSAEMVERCRAKGMRAEVGDLFETLAAEPESELGAVVSFHVVEHLPRDSLGRLIRLAWRALAPGGVLILESPSPLSLVVGARNFWLDPTHLRPIHPESLKAQFALNGFDPVEQLALQPFLPEDRLPDVELGDLAPELLPLAERLIELRDHLDSLLYGFQDFGMVGYKPVGARDGEAAGGLR